jgi:hypothetical protein
MGIALLWPPNSRSISPQRANLPEGDKAMPLIKSLDLMGMIAGLLQINKDAFGGFPKASLFEEGNKWIQKVKQGAGGYH